VKFISNRSKSTCRFRLTLINIITLELISLVFTIIFKRYYIQDLDQSRKELLIGNVSQIIFKTPRDTVTSWRMNRWKENAPPCSERRTITYRTESFSNLNLITFLRRAQKISANFRKYRSHVG
jgi:hypothetical protein